MSSHPQIKLTSNQPAPEQHLDHYVTSSHNTRTGLVILLLALVGFIVWAAFAPLDEGVPTEGLVNIGTNHKVVQHLNGGLVTALKVAEGQEVKKGDVLLVLDNAPSIARFEEIKQHYMGLRAQESRLNAEKVGAKAIQFHDDLVSNQGNPYIQQHMLNQSQLLMARQQALAADVAATYESIQGQKALIEGYQGVLNSLHTQLDLLNEQLNNIKALVNEGYAPRNQQNELEQKIAQTYGQIANNEANLLRSQKSILELNQQMNARQQLEKKEVDTEMAQVKLEVQSDAEKYKALNEDLSRTIIKAPATGQIVGLQIHTVGAVIQPGQKIMDIIPVGEALLLDAKIPPNLIDRVRTGQAADVRFSTFANSPQLLVDGKVETISKDLITDTSPNNQTSSYYLARISITPDGMKTLGHRQLQPGMPVQVVIKTGERTLLTYLLHPLMKRISASMKEE